MIKSIDITTDFERVVELAIAQEALYFEDVEKLEWDSFGDVLCRIRDELYSRRWVCSMVEDLERLPYVKLTRREDET